MFKVENVKVNVLGEVLEVMPLPVSKALAIRAEYLKLGEDDLEGLIDLMKRLIIDRVKSPVVTAADIETLDLKSLKSIFDAVAVACGMSSEKNEDRNKTS